MKKFEWRLQRVLDIRIMQEQKARSELFTITEQLAAFRTQLLLQKKILEDIINEMSRNNTKDRIFEQEFFLSNSAASNNKINKLKEKIKELELQQKQKIQDVLQLRKATEGMEKLRTEAKERYIKEQEIIEQKELDEESGILFVRNLI